VIDALLGAAGLPDIGDNFPDTDPRYKDADSRALFAEVMQKVTRVGYRVANVDVIVHAEAPKLSPYKQQMAGSIAGLCQCEAARVSVKAKTNEGVGPVGHGDAIACTAVAAIVRES
jgi:2-C-methyl-D-erythritol 2,4-cyclodiphosphate synthase